MTRPIKISDELYQRLKEQSRADGLTLQDALVELITTPHEGLHRLEGQLQESRRTLSAQQQSYRKLEQRIQELGKRVDSLFRLREKETEAWNGWAAVWKRVDPLANDVEALAARVRTLEDISHRHIGQATREDE